MDWLVGEYEGKKLQKSGMLTKEQVYAFMDKSIQQFNNPDFKQLMRLSHQAHRSTEEVINGMQREVFESLDIQGDFGINCLGKLNQIYHTDGAFMRRFMEFVSLEEQAMDEAEMPERLFKQKYEKLHQFKAVMEARLQQLQGLTKEEQQQYLANMYKKMIAQSVGQGACCSSPHGCSHRPAGGDAAAAAAGGSAVPSEVAAAAAAAQLLQGAAPAPSHGMTEEERLAFFAKGKDGQ